jgi:selenide, water dikinase
VSYYDRKFTDLKTDLLKFTDQGGCSAKIPPGQLEEILSHLPLPVDPDILVNMDTQDDAGVYRLNDETAIVFTTDFFPPVCSDPYEFGQIAAANSISDIYAMGANPVLALNIMMFPSSRLPLDVYAEILKGGFDKSDEAGVKIIGGHTIDDAVPKYGLAVVGFVNPGKIITNAGARAGDKLIITKPVGTGIILAAHRLGMSSEHELEEAKNYMKMLNSSAATIMRKYSVRGATDITGFGLAGHALKMARASNVSIRIDMSRVPLIGETLRLADEGCIPGACFTNLDYADNDLVTGSILDYNYKMIAFDAQTSGGILMSVPAEYAEKILTDLREEGLTSSSVIGEVDQFSGKFLQLS